MKASGATAVMGPFEEKEKELGSQPLQTVAQQWEKTICDGDGITTNTTRLLRQLKLLSSNIFSAPEDMSVEVAVLRSLKDADITQNTFYDTTSLRRNLSSIKAAAIYSICSANSVTPLKITAAGMESILEGNNVPLRFLDLLFSFGKGSLEAETGPGSMVFQCYTDGSFEMQYRLSYVEEEVGPSRSSWAIRQTGMFHRYVPDGPGSLFILLHPKVGSILQRRLDVLLSDNDDSRCSAFNANSIHLLFISSYIDGWRWYLQSLNTENERIAEVAISIDFSSESNHTRGLDMLQALHYLQEKVLPIMPRLKSTLTTIIVLLKYNKTLDQRGFQNKDQFSKMRDELEMYKSQCQGHISSAELLEKRVQDVLNLLGVALTLESQATALKINHNMLALTKDTVDDSATVRLVTIVTLIYLPASFVATFLGMNLFTYQSDDKPGFQISRQFWIFCALTVPLTLITVGAWLFVVFKRKSQREQGMIRENASYGSGQV